MDLSSNFEPSPQLNDRRVELIPKDPECIICYEEDVSEPKRKLDCGHEFHALCIDRWLAQKSTCPFCRRPSLPPSRPLHPLAPSLPSPGVGERVLASLRYHRDVFHFSVDMEKVKAFAILATLEMVAVATLIMPDYLDNPIQGIRKTALLASSLIYGTASFIMLGKPELNEIQAVAFAGGCAAMSGMMYSYAQEV